MEDLAARDDRPLERIRLAIVDLEAEGAKVTGRAVRERARVDANVVDLVLRAYRAGELPPTDQPWGDVPEPSEGLPDDLEEQIRGARTARRLERLGKLVLGWALRGTITPRVSDVATALLREQRQVIRMRREERRDKAVAALEVLTAEELAHLEAFRASRRPRPVAPGEAVPPPGEAPATTQGGGKT